MCFNLILCRLDIDVPSSSSAPRQTINSVSVTPFILTSHSLVFSLFFFCPFPTTPFFLQGEAPSKHIYKIPLSNLVGRSIERPLKSPLVNKVLTAPAPSVIGPAPMIASTTSLSLSRMEIKEIASRTRKELLGECLCVCALEPKAIITFVRHSGKLARNVPKEISRSISAAGDVFLGLDISAPSGAAQYHLLLTFQLWVIKKNCNDTCMLDLL